MARTVSEGKVKVYFCPAVADIEAPTEGEINAGTNLTPYVAKDGVDTPANQNMVDSATIEEAFDAQRVGSWGGSVTLTMFRDDEDETDSYDLITYGLAGFLVISRFGAPEAGSPVEVYPVEAHQPTTVPTSANAMQRFTAPFAVTSEPAMRAVVAAS
jgi:hypothetical protein